MRGDKKKAFAMRKLGKSYRQIRSELKVPLGTLSGWFSKVKWSGDIAKSLAANIQKQHTIRLVELNVIRGKNLSRLYEEARDEAKQELATLKYHPVFIAGMMLYWGEGDKGVNKTGVKLANTDPELIRLYSHFLTNVCRIPRQKIRAHVLVYPDLDEPSCRKFWSYTSGLPLSQFTKSTTITGRHETRRLSWGVCMITVSSSYFKEKMRMWLQLLPKELLDPAYYENIVRAPSRET